MGLLSDDQVSFFGDALGIKAISKAVDDVADAATQAVDAVGQAASDVASTASAVVGDVASTASAVVGDVASTASAVAGDVASTASQVATQAASTVTQAVDDVAQVAGNAVQAVQGVAGDAVQAVEGVASDASQAVSGLIDQATSAATSVVQSVVQGVGQLADDVLNQAKGLVADATAVPDKVAAGLAGLEQSGLDEARKLIDAAEQSAKAGLAGLETLGQLAKTAASAGVTLLQDMYHTAQQALKDGIAAAEQKGAELCLRVCQSKLAEFDAKVKTITDRGVAVPAYQNQSAQYHKRYDALSGVADPVDRMRQSLQLRGEIEADLTALSDAADKLVRMETEGVRQVTRDMRDQVTTLLGTPDKADARAAELQARLAVLRSSITAAEQADKDGTGAVGDRVAHWKQLSVTAEALMQDTMKWKRLPSNESDKIYAKLLKERFGVDVKQLDSRGSASDPNYAAGSKSLELKAMYEMLQSLPNTDVVHNKLKEYGFQPIEKDDHDHDKTKSDAYYSPDDAEIVMGDDRPYNHGAVVDPRTGEQLDSNHFDWNSMHEVGHAVDAQFRLTASRSSRPACGGWGVEDMTSVGKAYAKVMAAAATGADAPDPDKLQSLAEQALKGTVPASADEAGVKASVWPALQPVLQRCAGRKVTANPWDHPDNVDGRAYHEAYKDGWVSYSMASRGSLSVSGYQWRAPAEFFAELYAFSHLFKRLPPSGVDGDLTTYMWGGAAAGGAAP